MSSQKNIATSKIDFSEADHFFKTIGEVSVEIGVPPHVLRFWESKFLSVIKPHKRKGGHRYYSSADVDAVSTIKKLLYDEGYTIKGAQKYLRENRTMKQTTSIAQPSLFVEEVTQPTPKLAAIPANSDNFIEEPRNSVDKIDATAIQNLLKELEAIKKALES